MTDAQTATMAAVAARKELRALALKEDSSAEQLAEANKKLGDLEARSAALSASEPVVEVVKIEPVEDSQAKETRELRSRARVSDHLLAALTGRGVSGASAEYDAAMGTPPGLMSLELLDGPEPEKRAVSPGPAAEAVANTQPTTPYAFSRTDSAMLGVSMPMVAPGEAHFVAVSTSPPASVKAKDAAALATASAFSLEKRSPQRVTGQFLTRIEDLASFPSLEDDLRKAISAAVASALDDQIISSLYTSATDVALASEVETFATAVSRFAGAVDGLHANTFSDIRALIGKETFAALASLLVGAASPISAYDHLASKLGILRVSTRALVKANGGQKIIAILGAQGQPVTVPIFSGLELIVDPYTFSGKGQRLITAVLLFGSPFIPYGAKQVIELHPKL